MLAAIQVVNFNFGEFLVYGTFWFWAIILAEFVFLVLLVEREKYYAAPFTLIAVLTLLAFGGGFDVLGALNWVNHNRLMTLGIVIGWFIVGIFYVATPFIGRWACFVREVNEENQEYKRNWLLSLPNKLIQLREDIRGYNVNLTYSSRLGKLEDLQKQEVAYTNFVETFNPQKTNFNVGTVSVPKELYPFWKKYESETYYTDVLGRRVSIAKPLPENYKARIASWAVYWLASLCFLILNDPLRRIGNSIYYLVAKTLRKISDQGWQEESYPDPE